MRGITKLLGLLALSLVVGGSACAQGAGGGGGQGFGGRGQGFGMRGGGAMLLMASDVQADLKLTDMQKTQLRDTMQKMQTDAQGLREKLQNASQEERLQIVQKFQADQQKSVSAVLNPDQQKRLHQIELQQQGTMAIASPEVAAELKLTDDQKQRISAIMQEQQQAMRTLFQSAGGTGGFNADLRTKMQTLRKDAETKLAAVLTEDQQKQWKEIQGTPFTGRLVPGGPGGRPGGARPGAGGGTQP